MAYAHPAYPAPEHYALYGDLTGVAWNDRDQSKAWWGLITAKPCSHTKSLFNDETQIHYEYQVRLNGSFDSGVRLKGWSLSRVFWLSQWYSEVRFTITDPKGKADFIALDALRVWGLKDAAKPPYPVHFVALGIQFLRRICGLTDWAHYHSLPKLRAEKLTLENGIADLTTQASENRIALAAKIKALKKKAKLTDQRLTAKAAKVQAGLAAVLAKLPSET